MKKQIYKLMVNEKSTITSEWLIPDHFQTALIIAHGAGNGMDSPFISYLHKQIANHDILTVKFNFPYMEKARKTPDRAQVLEATWLKVIDSVIKKTHLSAEQIFLSGKSMGGRYASMIASKQNFAVILYGYPLHAPGKPLNLRIEHFKTISCPILIFQGTRDSLCQLDKLQESLEKYAPDASLHIIEGGDHSFKTLKRMNRTEESVWQEIVLKTVEWINKSNAPEKHF